MNSAETKTSGKNMALVTSLTMLAKLFAIARQMVLTYCYGAGTISDAYLLAQSIPNTLFLLVSTAIGASFTPVLSRVSSIETCEKTNRFISNVITIVSIVAGILVLITLVFSRQIVFIFANGFSEETAELTASFLRICVIGIVFIGTISIYSAFLRLNGDYFTTSIIGIALSCVEITTCVIAYKTNLVVLPIGILLAAAVQWLIVAGSSRRKGYVYRPYINLQSKYVRDIALMSVPIMIALGVDEINVIVDRTMASTFQSGSISALTYANTIVGIIHNVISVSINAVIFVDVTKAVSAKDNDAVSKHIHNGIEKAVLLLIPATVGLIAYSRQITQLIYQRGSFDTENTRITAEAMSYYALYIVPNGIRIIVQSYYYAHQKTRVCLYAGLLGVGVNIVFNVVLSKVMGINGLAIATTLGVLASSMFLLIRYLKDTKPFPCRKAAALICKLSVSSGIMIIVSLFIYKMIHQALPLLAAMAVSVITAIITYGVCLIIFKVVNPMQLKDFAVRIFKK